MMASFTHLSAVIKCNGELPWLTVWPKTCVYHAAAISATRQRPIVGAATDGLTRCRHGGGGGEYDNGGKLLQAVTVEGMGCFRGARAVPLRCPGGSRQHQWARHEQEHGTAAFRPQRDGVRWRDGRLRE